VWFFILPELKLALKGRTPGDIIQELLQASLEDLKLKTSPNSTITGLTAHHRELLHEIT
jgi:hypothetical protein